ncbi:MAG: ABC transporter permease [Firmicutes bacterium]|nr:ABC transporter permease [Bacillota bacterium]
MARYIFKRILLVIPVVLAVILLVFGLLYITPGSNMDRMAVYTGDAFDGVLEKIEPASGFFARYMRYCYNIFFKFEFGYGGRGSADIGAQMKLRWGWTLRLAGLSLLVSALIGIPAGVISAVTSGGWQDRVISAVATVFSSIPSYCMAVGLALLFALKLGWLPSYGVVEPKALVMPVVTVSAMGISQFIRVVRSAVSETLEKNYITALRAAGLKERLIIGVHALRNALVPIAASLGETATKILGGGFVAEKFFAVPGIGFYLIKAVDQVQPLIILACASSTAVLLVLINLATDMISLAADPQLRKRVASAPGRGGRSDGK